MTGKAAENPAEVPQTVAEYVEKAREICPEAEVYMLDETSRIEVVFLFDDFALLLGSELCARWMALEELARTTDVRICPRLMPVFGADSPREVGRVLWKGTRLV